LFAAAGPPRVSGALPPQLMAELWRAQRVLLVPERGSQRGEGGWDFWSPAMLWLLCRIRWD